MRLPSCDHADKFSLAAVWIGTSPRADRPGCGPRSFFLRASVRVEIAHDVRQFRRIAGACVPAIGAAVARTCRWYRQNDLAICTGPSEYWIQLNRCHIGAADRQSQDVRFVRAIYRVGVPPDLGRHTCIEQVVRPAGLVFDVDAIGTELCQLHVGTAVVAECEDFVEPGVPRCSAASHQRDPP